MRDGDELDHLYEDECACGNYSLGGSWCKECLDSCDSEIEAHEERKRKRMFEDEEY